MVIKNILIIGISGYLGSNLCNSLKKKYKIYGTTFTEHATRKFNLNNPEIETSLVDISKDKFKLEKIIIEKKIDCIVNCAAMKHVNICEKNTQKCVEVNIVGNLNILEIAKRNCVKKVLSISTDKSIKPSCVYGMSKKLMENITIENGYSVYRGVNFFGSNGSVLDIWKNQLNDNISLTANKTNTYRYFSRIEDVCRDIELAIKSNKSVVLPKLAYKVSLHDLLLAFSIANNYNNIDYYDNPVYEKEVEDINDEIKVINLSKDDLIKWLT